MLRFRSRARELPGHRRFMSTRHLVQAPSGRGAIVAMDISDRYTASTHHDRPRHPRPPRRAGPARLRAQEAARRAGRRALGHLVRVAVPGAGPAREGRRGQGGRGPHGRRHHPHDRGPERRDRRLPGPASAARPRAAAPRRSTASPRSAAAAWASCWSTTPPTTAPSPCRSPSATPCCPSSASPCSSGAAPCSSGAWPSASRVSGGRTDTYRSSLREHDTRTITHDLAWIDELIGAARAELAASGGPETHLNGGSHP